MLLQITVNDAQVVNFCNSFKEEKQYMLLQITTNDPRNGSSVEGSFPSTHKPIPLVVCGVFKLFKQIFKKIQTKKETTSCIPKITALLRQ